MYGDVWEKLSAHSETVPIFLTSEGGLEKCNCVTFK